MAITQGEPESAEPEHALLARARGGDGDALQQLLQRYQGRVYRFSMRMCRDPEDAKDVLQDTLFAAARGLKDYRADAKVSTWLFAIARSFCIKKRRGLTPAVAERGASDELVETGPAPDELVGNRELLSALQSAMHVLDPENRAILLLRDVEGFSAIETAETMGMTVAQVKSRLHRARESIREYMRPALEEVLPIEGDRQPSCPDIVHMFSRYLEDEIGPDMCTRMQDHIDACSYCRTTCDTLKRTVSVCNAVPTPDVPRDVQVALRHEIRRIVER